MVSPGLPPPPFITPHPPTSRSQSRNPPLFHPISSKAAITLQLLASPPPYDSLNPSFLANSKCHLNTFLNTSFPPVSITSP